MSSKTRVLSSLIHERNIISILNECAYPPLDNSRRLCFRYFLGRLIAHSYRKINCKVQICSNGYVWRYTIVIDYQFKADDYSTLKWVHR